MITVGRVDSSSDWEAFLRFPWRIYADFPQWVPPLIAQQKRELKRDSGPFFNDGFGSSAAFFLARHRGEVCGRIAAIRNERHLQCHRDGVGFFGFFESLDDPAVARALLDSAEAWLIDQNLCISRGPASFTIYDPAGLTVEGGHLRPGFGMAFTPPYYPALLETCGYHKVRDLHAYHLPIENFNSALLNYRPAFPDIDLSEIEIRTIRRDQLDRDAEIFAGIVTAAWESNWGAFPILPEDFLQGVEELGPYLDEQLGYVASIRGEPVGIFLAIADPWEIIRQLDGKLGPRGYWKLWRHRDRITHFRVILMGVLLEHHNGPVAALMLERFQQTWSRFPAMESVEFSWILEDNLRARDLATASGAKPLQTFRVYDKFI